ncbi:MAG TPA: DsbA family protein [Gemmatimonadaceae bacterium]|nr:DsbA family protein [Gemmatimonadaceae bacterium]
MAAPTPKVLQARQWRPLLQTGHRIGPTDAKLTIIEFGDFQCPVCGVFERTLDSMWTRHPSEFAVVFHHFPLSYHPLAYPLARASECAAHQGRFTAFHDSVYAEQRLLGVVPIIEFGVRAGVRDTAAFRRCVLSTSPVPEIDRDVAYAKQIGVPGTPGVILDGTLRSGDVTLQELEHALSEAEDAK